MGSRTYMGTAAEFADAIWWRRQSSGAGSTSPRNQSFARRMNPYWLIVAFTLLTQFCIFVRWLHRRMRTAEVERAFVHDLARIHLPHLYHALHLIAARLGITLEDLRSLDIPDRDCHDKNTDWHAR